LFIKFRFFQASFFLVRGTVPEFFRFFEAAMSKRGRFSGVFRGSGSFSKTLIWAFYEVFSSAPIANAHFLREIRGFSARTFSRVFFPIRLTMPQARSPFCDDHLLAGHFMAAH
jgi:hypothetical protein